MDKSGILTFILLLIFQSCSNHKDKSNEKEFFGLKSMTGFEKLLLKSYLINGQN
ncbi:hypothetical protein [Flavobacterium gelatinilyticum]|uniref:hypothetical protein n=1 Tax=Flavobacterium gelatinilyticum TaxID=3003260 RepID=UPI00248189E7|nr:hypothetical protein [Flavobacterium gelatinilyticum]